MLAALFDGAVRGDPPGEFLHRLEDLAQASLSGGESVENWWRVLYALRQLATRVTTDAAEIARVEDLWLHAQMLLNEVAERYWRFSGVLWKKKASLMGRRWRLPA